MKQAGQRRDVVPAGMREQLGVCCRSFYTNNLGTHFEKIRVLKLRYRKAGWQVLKIAKAIPPRLS